MTTHRKIPHSRIPPVDGDGLMAREWFELLEREQHVGTPATAASAGAATLPATPEGFITVTVNGQQCLVPYYLP